MSIKIPPTGAVVTIKNMNKKLSSQVRFNFATPITKRLYFFVGRILIRSNLHFSLMMFLQIYKEQISHFNETKVNV
jgi:hypothetical protein